MGQFDKLRAKLVAKPNAALQGGFPLDESNQISQEDIRPATSTRSATIPPSATRPGYVVQENFGSERSAEDTQGGAPAKPEDLSTTRASYDIKRVESAKKRAATREAISGRRKEMSAGLASTSKRLDPKTGEVYDTVDTGEGDYRAPAWANPKSLLVSKGTVPANTSTKPEDWPETPNYTDYEKQAIHNKVIEIMAPGKRKAQKKYAKQAKQQALRNDMLANEREINAKEEASGTTLRVKNGITYDLADREAEAAEAAKSAKSTGQTFFNQKLDKQKRPVFKRVADKTVEYTFNGKKYTKASPTWEPVGKTLPIKKETKPSTFDADLEGITSGNQKLGETEEDAKLNGKPFVSPIPKSPYTEKNTPEGEDVKFGQADSRPSSIISTSEELKKQGTKTDKEPGLSSGTDSKDIDNPTGDAYEDAAIESKTEEYDPESEEGQEAAETAKYEGVKDTPRDRAEAEREQSVRKAALEYEKKQKEKNRKRGPRKPKRLDAEGNVIPEEVDRGPNFKSQYEDPLDEQGNVKPEYNDMENHPERTTTMRELPISKNVRLEPVEDEVASIGSEPNPRGTAAEERGRRAQAGSDILEHGVSKQMQGAKTQVVEGRWDRVAKAIDNNGRIVPTKSGNVVPMRAFEDTSAPGSEAITYKEAEKSADAVPLSDDARFKEANKNRTAVTKTGIVNPGSSPSGATAGRNAFQSESDTRRRAKFEAKLGDDNVDTRYEKKVNDTAMDLAMREGTIKNAGDLDNPAVMTGTGMKQHIAKAYVLHSTGGASDEAEAKLDKVTGGPRGSATNTTAIAGMHDTLKDEERFHATKMPGTGVTYSMDNSGQNKIDPEKAHFRAKNGSIVPFSEVSHPDHPLKGGSGVLEGSAVPFVGGVPKAGGGLTPISMHEGWHPTTGFIHPETGKRITLFEKNHVPENAVHEAHVIREAVSTGNSLNVTRKKLYAGEDTGMTLPSGDAVTTASPAPIKGASRKKHEEIASTLAADLEKSGVAAPTTPMGPAELPAERSAWPRVVAPETSVIKPEAETGEGGQARGEAVGGQILSQGDRLPTKEERAEKAKANKLGVKGERSVRQEAIAKERSATAPMFKPGESVYHPKHGVGTVISHGIDMGGKGTTTAVVKFGEKEKTFTGDNIHTHVSDAQGKTTKGQELSRYTPASTPATVTHKQHGSGSVLGYISNTDGSGKTHVKFDSGDTKAVTDNKIKF